MPKLIVDHAEQAKAVFVFAHGAGAGMQHEFMETVSQQLVAQHITVVRFNFTYMHKRQLDGKRYPPDRMPKLLAAYQQVIAQLAQYELSQLPLFIGGKSMGSRVAVMLANEFDDINSEFINKKVAGIICLGYPFHPAKKPESLRLLPLQQVKTNTLIIQGECDALGNKQEIANYELPNHCSCQFLANGDHSFKPRVKSGFTQFQHIQTAVAHITEFINDNG